MKWCQTPLRRPPGGKQFECTGCSAPRRLAVRTLFILLLVPLFSITPALAEPGFSEKYERDSNIFNPLNQYRADNPLNPINAYNPKNPLNPLNQYDPGNPTHPMNQYNPSNPYNPLNQFNPKNPLNPLNEYNPTTPFRPLNSSPRPSR